MLGPNPDEKGGMGKVSKLIRENVAESIEIQYISTWNGKDANRLTNFAQALMAFLWQLIGGKVDLVHIHISERGSVLRKSIIILISLAYQKPIILHTHGAEFTQFHEELPKPIKRAVNWMFQQCNYVIALSESWKQFYIKNCHLAPDRVIRMYNPVTIPSRIPNRSSSHPLKFVFLGKITPRKGIDDLLNAFASLPIDQQNQVQIVLAGTGEEEAAKQLAKQLGIENHVKFPGWIDEKQRDDLLSQAQAFLLPSYQEGLPMALLEAMSWELPCITTPVGGIPEVITDQETGLLVEPGNVQKLACAMQTLIENESLRLRIGKASREKAKDLDIKRYCVFLSDIYEQSAKKYDRNEMAVKNTISH
ncbi:glycosyltransferase family 4 protein [Lyngbya sp. CCY1209]|uniref:glycosyltransferase family 4 protein n=1 Tax=Lyngbya sp. CCY1209 TaxID=2886103 RepID=UPI002D2000B5|nr:glycosyltransferase family 4 protein [Lyngbya sp. CCY1209]MEB3887038.1 glycosyltransferase family 4 protein [Lyngbya sp. CCY1209]